MSLYGAFDQTKHLDELDSPLETQEGVLTPAQRRARVSANVFASGVTNTLNGVLDIDGTIDMDGAVTAGTPRFDIDFTSSSTNGGTSVQGLTVQHTMTGAGGVGGRSYFGMDTNVALGSWSNAIKGEVTYGASGSTSGLGSVVLGEMTLSAGTSAGNYALFEGELNLGTGALTGTATSLMYFSINGDDAATFDTSGYLMNVQGATGAEDKFFDDAVEISNVNEITGGLRIKVGAQDYYILLATAADAADA